MRIISLVVTALCFFFAIPSSAYAANTELAPSTEHSPEGRTPDSGPMPPEAAGGAICWRGESGFLIGLPDGWRNAPEAATHYNLCFMAIPEGTGFNEAPAVFYPLIFDRSPGQSPADVADNAARIAREAQSRAPGGENISVRGGESFTTVRDLPVEIRYFDNGPYPNAFEAVAYVVHDTAVLGLVLSATTNEARDTFLSALLTSARGVAPLKVDDKRKSPKSSL